MCIRDRVRSPLPHPLLPLLGFIKTVQQSGKALKGLRFRRKAVLVHRQSGKFKGNTLPFQNDRRKPVFLYALCKRKESVLKAASAGLVQIAEPAVRFPAGPKAEFPGCLLYTSPERPEKSGGHGG